jgi:hypothetical protein
MTETAKQSVVGFKVVDFAVKKKKDNEIVKLVLVANVDSMGAGDYDVGEILKALLHHQTGDVDVGLSVFMQEKEKE